LQHIKCLDGLRALAVLLVIIAHSGFGHIIPGGFGVTVFFFLSGFLITTLLQRELETTGTISYKNFMIRRGLRIFTPLYIIYFFLLAMTWLDIYPATYTLDGVLSQLFFYSNYMRVFGSFESLLDGTGQLWSLSVEEHFYIIFPIVFIILMNINKYYLLYFSIVLAIFILLWRLYLSGYELSFDRFYLATDTRFDSILYGVILSLIMYQNGLFVEAKTKLVKSDWLLLLSALTLLILSFIIRDDFFRRTIRYSLQGIALIPLFYYAVTRPNLIYFRWLNTSIFISMGLYSYVIYLIHNPIIHLLESYGMKPGLLLLIIVLVFSYLFAALFYRFIESPVLQFKHKFSSGKK